MSDTEKRNPELEKKILELRQKSLDQLAELDEELGLYDLWSKSMPKGIANPDAPGAPKEGAD